MLDMNNIIFRGILIPAKNVPQSMDELWLTAVNRLQRLAGRDGEGGVEKRSPDRLHIIIYRPASGLQSLRVRQIDLSRPDGEYIHFVTKA
jgi:hypothetical protein